MYIPLDAAGLCTSDSCRRSRSPFNPPWLLYLCIVFGVLFLFMLVVNVFLCSAMTCSCARGDGADGGDGGAKGDSIVEEFDPYTRSWHGSQYGSR